jgi:hypothetical protein
MQEVVDRLMSCCCNIAMTHWGVLSTILLTTGHLIPERVRSKRPQLWGFFLIRRRMAIPIVCWMQENLPPI